MSRSLELFGTIALRSNLLTHDDLNQALNLQHSQTDKERKKIGEILVEMDVMQPSDVRHIVDVQQLMRVPTNNFRLCLHLLKNGLATKNEMEDCLKRQGRNQDTQELANLMVHKGILSKEQKENALQGLRKAKTHHFGSPSMLVKTLNRAEIEQNHAQTTQFIPNIRLSEAKQLINEGVRNLTHVGILSYFVDRKGKGCTFRELQKAIDKEKQYIQNALDDLAAIKIIHLKKALLRDKYFYTKDERLQRRVDFLLSAIAEKRIKKEILKLLLTK